MAREKAERFKAIAQKAREMQKGQRHEIHKEGQSMAEDCPRPSMRPRGFPEQPRAEMHRTPPPPPEIGVLHHRGFV